MSYRFEWKEGDKLEVIEDYGVLVKGEIHTANEDVCTDDENYTPNATCPKGEIYQFYVMRFRKVESKEQSLTPFKKTKMNKKIIKVLAVDKKTSKVLKNISVVAENEQTAILKAFGVDVEKVYIKTTEEGDFEEEKPVKVILDKAETKPKTKPAS